MNKTKETKMDYKKEIYLLKLSRKEIAAKLNLKYSALASRLNSFSPWKYDEEENLQQIIKEAKGKKAS
jgi:hypothetical protein